MRDWPQGITCPSRAITSRMLTWSPSFATTLLMVTRPASISRSASRREQIPCSVKNLLMRMVSVTESALVDAPAGLYSSQDTIDQPGDTKLGSHESFDWRNLADVHPENPGPVGQRGDEIQRVVPTEPAWFGRPQGGNQRGVEAVTIKGQIHRSPTGRHDIGNPPSGFPFVGTQRVQQLGGKKGRALIGARDSGDFLRTYRSNPNLYQRQFVIDHACHDTGMAVEIVLVGMAQVPVRVDLYDGQTGVPLRMRPDRP